jgi:hypothetical protein
MQGQYQMIGGRKTYVPPFVNERFDGPPYWACTFTSLLNGANVGWLGEKPATQREVRALARASGDVDLRGGSRSSHMVRAVKVRYGQDIRIEHRTPQQAADRLKSGWAMVAAVTYGGLPKHYRRWSPRFTGGHRVVLLGWQDNRTRLLDPMASHGPDYGGEWISWSDFEPAWWAGEQLWFREGMFLPAPSVEPPAPSVEPAPNIQPAPNIEPTPNIEPPAPVDAPGPWHVAAGTIVDFQSQAGVVLRRVRIERASGAMFDEDILLDASPGSGDPQRRLIRVSSGRFKGYFVDIAAPGVSIGALQEP